MASRPIKSIEVILLLPAFFNGVICLHFSFIFLRHYLFIPITTKRPVLTFYAMGKKQRIFSPWLCFNKSLFRNIPQSTTQSARTSNCFPVLFASDDEEFNPFLSPTSTQSSRVINNNDHSNLANHKTGGNDKPKLPILHQLSLENGSGLSIYRLSAESKNHIKFLCSNTGFHDDFRFRETLKKLYCVPRNAK